MKMYIMTPPRPENVKARWWSIHKFRLNEQTPDGRTYNDIYERLKGLPDNPSREEIEEIIGNDTWTRIYCDTCKNERTALTEIGDENVCSTCLRHAAEKVERFE